VAGDEARSQTVRVGALSALLQDLVRADVPEPVSTWEEALKPGAIIGRFELDREIGRGGFGVVWEARDPSLGRAVALKAVRPRARADLREERLLREAEAAARLSHPNIVTLYDVGQTEHGPYLVLELLRGEALAQRLGRCSVPVREALRIAVEAAKGLAHAHAEGVIHRDLTPGNVFLCADGQVKVLDFGMAHAFGRRKVDGGTRAYMAPEQARGAPEDERTDVFALGVILHQMLSGELPFPDAEALLRPSPAPGLEIPEAPALGALVGRMLEKDPVKRPRDAGEVLAALTAIQRELEQAPSTGRSQVRTRPSSTGLKDFLAELKRRRVIRALLGWGIFSFAVLQIYEPVMHGLHLPDWTLSAVVVVLASGFPATMILAWIFDIRSGGIERTVPEGGGGMPGRSRLRGKRLALLLVGTGVVAAVPLVAWYFFRSGPGFFHGRTAPTATQMTRVAVLPFANLSGDPGQEYLGDGIAEEIAERLSTVVPVIAGSSVERYKHANPGAQAIGRELGVAFIVEGRVRRAAERVRVNAALVRAADSRQMWTDQIDIPFDQVLELQERVASRVVSGLGITLGPEQLGQKGTRNTEAYDEYLQCRFAFYSVNDTGKALPHCERALALDRAYAPAMAFLAILEAGEYDDGKGPEHLDRADSLLKRALRIDSHLTGVRFADANVRGSGFDYQGAAAELEELVREEPLNAEYWHILCYELSHVWPRRLAEAEQACRRSLELNPNNWATYYHLVRAMSLQGKQAEAEKAQQQLEQLLPGSDYVAWGRFLIAMEGGRPRDALAALQPTSGANKLIAWQAAGLAQAGQIEEAFVRLEEALDAGYRDVAELRNSRWYEPLRKDPRFEKLLAKHGLWP